MAMLRSQEYSLKIWRLNSNFVLVFFSEGKVDLRGLRLDWFRFQAYVSMGRSALSLPDNRRFAVTMNTTVFHLKMIDLLEEMLRETSDLSIYWWVFLVSFPLLNQSNFFEKGVVDGFKK